MKWSRAPLMRWQTMQVALVAVVAARVSRIIGPQKPSCVLPWGREEMSIEQVVTVSLSTPMLEAMLADAHAIDGEWGTDNGTEIPAWHDILAVQIGGCRECEARREEAIRHGWTYG